MLYSTQKRLFIEMLHAHSKYIYNTHVICVKITKITASLAIIDVIDDKL